jgi:hypothetical protein
LGYYAVAPELFARATDTSKLTTIDGGRAAAAKVSDKQVVSDLDADDGLREDGKGRRQSPGHHGRPWRSRGLALPAHSLGGGGVVPAPAITGPTNEDAAKNRSIWSTA